MKTITGTLLLLIGILLGATAFQLFQEPINHWISSFTKEESLPSLRIFSLDDFSNPEDIELNEKVEEIFIQLSPKQQVAQLLMPAIDRNTDIENIRTMIQKEEIGGLMILDPQYDHTLTQELQVLNSLYNPTKLLFSIDAEPSLLPYRIPELSEIPPTNQQNTIDDVSLYANQIAQDLSSKNIHINFAPVYDANVNTDIIGNRSFGSNANQITPLAQAFNQAMIEFNIAPTAKHFPGHGLVSGDSHINLVTIDGDLDELDSFNTAIEDQIPLVMIGHIAITNNQLYDTKGLPASLSRKIVTNLLKGELGFQGIAITDALNMGALDTFDNPGLQALKAGNDIVLIPSNENQLIYEVLQEMELNPEFKNQIKDSVRKVLRMKVCLRLTTY